jgi:hypothetical protein
MVIILILKQLHVFMYLQKNIMYNVLGCFVIFGIPEASTVDNTRIFFVNRFERFLQITNPLCAKQLN